MGQNANIIVYIWSPILVMCEITKIGSYIWLFLPMATGWHDGCRYADAEKASGHQQPLFCHVGEVNLK